MNYIRLQLDRNIQPCVNRIYNTVQLGHYHWLIQGRDGLRGAFCVCAIKKYCHIMRQLPPTLDISIYNPAYSL